MLRKIVVFLWCFYQITSLPTMYKYNENKQLEPDLVPVSSTVIPLPVYQVSYGVNVAASIDKPTKPEEKPTLITVYTRKKAGEIDDKAKLKVSSSSKSQ